MEPATGCDSTQMRSPWNSTIFLQMANPIREPGQSAERRPPHGGAFSGQSPPEEARGEAGPQACRSGSLARLRTRRGGETAAPGCLPLATWSSRHFYFFGVFELIDSLQQGFWIRPPAERPQRPVLCFPSHYELPTNLNLDSPEGINLLHTAYIMDILSPLFNPARAHACLVPHFAPDLWETLAAVFGQEPAPLEI